MSHAIACNQCARLISAGRGVRLSYAVGVRPFEPQSDGYYQSQQAASWMGVDLHVECLCPWAEALAASLGAADTAAARER